MQSMDKTMKHSSVLHLVQIETTGVIAFGIPQASPTGTVKQILIKFWQVIHKAR